MFYPSDYSKKIWELFMILCLLTTCVSTPYNLAFVDIMNEVEWYYILYHVMDAAFLIDIFVNFCSAYHNESYEIIDNRKQVFCTYLKGWFIFDFLAIFPFE